MKKPLSEAKPVFTANLKLIVTSEKENLLLQVCLTDQSCLKYTACMAFENGKLSSDMRLQKHLDLIKSAKEVPQAASRNSQVTTPKHKGTPSVQYRLVALSRTGKQFTVDINNHITKQVVICKNFIKLRKLTLILRIFPSVLSKELYNNRVPRTGNKEQYCHLYPVFCDHLRRKANVSQSKWSYAELDGFIQYKVVMNNSSAIRVDADCCSQSIPCCGHTNKHNCLNQGLTIRGSGSREFELCADLVGG